MPNLFSLMLLPIRIENMKISLLGEMIHQRVHELIHIQSPKTETRHEKPLDLFDDLSTRIGCAQIQQLNTLSNNRWIYS